MSKSSAGAAEMSEKRKQKQDLTAALEVLTDDDRRDAIEYLALADDTVSFEDLVDFMAATGAPEGMTSQRRKRTAIRFYHTHLPKMDAAGLLNYDPDEQVIEPTETVTAAMKHISRESDSRP